MTVSAVSPSSVSTAPSVPKAGSGDYFQVSPAPQSRRIVCSGSLWVVQQRGGSSHWEVVWVELRGDSLHLYDRTVFVRLRESFAL